MVLLNLTLIPFLRSHFIGSTNVQSNPDFYLNACMECFDYYLANLLLDDSTPVPLIINTIGWVEGEHLVGIIIHL